MDVSGSLGGWELDCGSSAPPSSEVSVQHRRKRMEASSGF